jgi:hypothetical protein
MDAGQWIAYVFGIVWGMLIAFAAYTTAWPLVVIVAALCVIAGLKTRLVLTDK